jgi:hypothetical protein
MERLAPTTPSFVVPKLVERPKFIAKNAKKIKVWSNHYDISFKGTRVYQWYGEFSPELPDDSRQVIDEVYRFNSRAIRDQIGPYIRAVNTIFSFTPPKNKLITFNKHEQFELTLKKTDKEMNFEALMATDERRFEVMRVINIGVKQIMKENKYLEFGIDRKFYDSNPQNIATETIGDFSLRFMQGFKTTIDVYQNGTPKVLVDCCSRIIREYNMWEEFLWFRDQGMEERKILDEFILGRSFLTTYGNQRIYRIDEVDYNTTLLSKFPNDKFANYLEYFQVKYGIKIKNKDQFLVIHIRKVKKMIKGKMIKEEERVHLVPELLLPTGMTDEMRADNNAMRVVANYTQIPPHKRDMKQKRLLAQINSSANELNLKVDPTSNEIGDAIFYAPPRIKLRKEISAGKGNFIIKEPILSTNAKLSKWLIILEKEYEKEAMDLAMTMKKASKSLGISVAKPKLIFVKKRNRFVNAN